MVKQEILFDELKKEIVYPVYLLLGEDTGSKDDFIRGLQAHLFKGDDKENVNISVYYGDEAATDDIIQNLSTFSFFMEKKLVVVKDFEKLKSLKLISVYLESPSGDVVLVLLTQNKSAPKDILSGVEKHGRACILWPMFQTESEGWIVAQLDAQGIKAEPEAVKYIVDVSGTTRNELQNQINCIVNYFARGEVLTLEKAKNIVSKLNTYTVFDLCNALFVIPPGEILKIFRYLVNNGEDFVKISYFCNREIGKLLEAYALKMGGSAYSQISRSMGFRKKEAARVWSVLKKVELKTLRRLYSSAVSLDYTIKSKPKDVSIIAFERFLLALGCH